jgi:hypothetical protein
MFSRKTILIFLLTVIPFTTNRLASAQAVANAQVHGTVQDATGAVVIGARIKATQRTDQSNAK